MTIKELAMIGARLRIRELMREVKEIKILMKNRKVKLVKKYAKRKPWVFTKARRLHMKNLNKELRRKNNERS